MSDGTISESSRNKNKGTTVMPAERSHHVITPNLTFCLAASVTALKGVTITIYLSFAIRYIRKYMFSAPILARILATLQV